jgi:ankyrin repeat protein
LSFFTLTTVHPKLRDIDAAEFIFVPYGCYLYLRCRNLYNRVFPIFAVCHSGNLWAVDLLLSVAHLTAFYVQDSETGDTPLHYLAKEGHTEILSHILVMGFVDTPVLNDEGRRFTYYIKDAELQSLMEAHLDRWVGRLNLKVPVRKEVSVPEDDYPPGINQAEITKNLLLEARAVAFAQVTKNNRSKLKKNKKKNQVIIIRAVTEKDEERAQQAEKELFAMIEKEQQELKHKQKRKKCIKKWKFY